MHGGEAAGGGLAQGAGAGENGLSSVGMCDARFVLRYSS